MLKAKTLESQQKKKRKARWKDQIKLNSMTWQGIDRGKSEWGKHRRFLFIYIKNIFETNDRLALLQKQEMFSLEVDYIVTKYTTHPSAIAVSHSIACDSRKTAHTRTNQRHSSKHTALYIPETVLGKFLYRVFQLYISTQNNSTDLEVLHHKIHIMALLRLYYMYCR